MRVRLGLIILLLAVLALPVRAGPQLPVYLMPALTLEVEAWPAPEAMTRLVLTVQTTVEPFMTGVGVLGYRGQSVCWAILFADEWRERYWRGDVLLEPGRYRIVAVSLIRGRVFVEMQEVLVGGPLYQGRNQEVSRCSERRLSGSLC